MVILYVSLSAICAALGVYWYMNRHKPINNLIREFIHMMDMNGAGAGGLIDDWVNARRNRIELPDAKQKIGVVTGGARGIGKEVIRGMLKANMKVIIGIRNPELVVELARNMANGQNLQAYKLDLQSLKSVKEFAEKVLKDHSEINILVNNAGIMFPGYQVTEDGFESHLAVNHLSHFYLTYLLLPALKSGGMKRGYSRVVNVTSCGHYAGKIYFEDINMKEYYDDIAAYAQSKLAQLMTTRFLNKMFEEKNIPVRCYSVHPGLVNTDLFTNSLINSFPWAMKLFFKTPEKGATSILYACFEENLDKRGGLYISNCGEGISNRFSKNERHQKRLFEISCELVGINNNLFHTSDMSH